MQFSLHICITTPQRRVDAYLSKLYPERSRSFFQYLIEHGSLSINKNVITKSSTSLSPRDEVIVLHEVTDTPWHITGRSDIPLAILYEDKDTLVINKPLGLTVHPGDDKESQTTSVAHALLGLPGVVFSIKDSVRPGIVHRLDKWTSGILLTAKNDQAVEFYSSQFKNRSVKKEYLALVHGKMPQAHGLIEGPIGRSPQDRKKMAIVEHGKHAKTEFFVVASTKDYTLVRVLLHTGRTHQIRVHFSSIGFPLVGDNVYGSRKDFPKLQGQWLHAWKLTFIPTHTHLPVTITAPVPSLFETIIQTIGFQIPDNISS